MSLSGVTASELTAADRTALKEVVAEKVGSVCGANAASVCTTEDVTITISRRAVTVSYRVAVYSAAAASTGAQTISAVSATGMATSIQAKTTNLATASVTAVSPATAAAAPTAAPTAPTVSPTAAPTTAAPTTAAPTVPRFFGKVCYRMAGQQDYTVVGKPFEETFPVTNPNLHLPNPNPNPDPNPSPHINPSPNMLTLALTVISYLCAMPSCHSMLNVQWHSLDGLKTTESYPDWRKPRLADATDHAEV